MAARAGTRDRRAVQGEHLATNRTTWRSLVPIAALVLALSAGALAFLHDELALFVAGGVVSSIGWWASIRSPAAAGVGRAVPASTLLSLDGEAMTADQVDGLAGLGFLGLHHLPLEHGHIDHVVVGPGGVFAVETALSTALWTLNVPDARLLDAAAEAKRSAAKTRSILRSQGVAADVLPLLVLWGDVVGTAELVDGVAVVHGDALPRWFEERSVGAGVDVARVEAALTAFVSPAQ